MSLQLLFRRLLRKFGVDVVKYKPSSNHNARLFYLMENIDVVLDVGANEGQYGEYLRNFGYKNLIISFEPMEQAYSELCNNKEAKDDSLWLKKNIALGDEIGEKNINISKYSPSSSILEMLPLHEKIFSGTDYIGEESIKIEKLDNVFQSLCTNSSKVLLKIDTQGFEYEVLKGAKKSLDYISLIQLEMSYKPLYQNELLFDEMHEFLSSRGYYLVSVSPQIFDEKTWELIQVDALYKRHDG